jgi:hypothetical protein
MDALRDKKYAESFPATPNMKKIGSGINSRKIERVIHILAVVTLSVL